MGQASSQQPGGPVVSLELSEETLTLILCGGVIIILLFMLISNRRRCKQDDNEGFHNATCTRCYKFPVIGRRCIGCTRGTDCKLCAKIPFVGKKCVNLPDCD